MRYGNATKSPFADRDELPDVYCPQCNDETAKQRQVDNSYDDHFGNVTDWDVEDICDECGAETWDDKDEWIEYRTRLIKKLSASLTAMLEIYADTPAHRTTRDWPDHQAAILNAHRVIKEAGE